MPASARRQLLICTLLVINSIALSSGECHPPIPCVNNFEPLSVLSLLHFFSLLDITLDLPYSGSLANKQFNTLK